MLNKTNSSKTGGLGIGDLRILTHYRRNLFIGFDRNIKYIYSFIRKIIQ